MDTDCRTIVTGGGTGGEGLKIWDLRNLKAPVTKIPWTISSMGQAVNPSINCAKFVPGMGLLVAGSSNDTPAKCFNYKAGGVVVQDFYKLKKSCFSIDVSQDKSLLALGDYTGQLQVENLVYASV